MSLNNQQLLSFEYKDNVHKLPVKTRLDNLLSLLDFGSNPAIRRAAALQIGEVQKCYPNELKSLLSRVQPYLLSSTWETRIAASTAIREIVNNTKCSLDNLTVHNSPNFYSLLPQDNRTEPSIAFSLDDFDIRFIIEEGVPLLGSAGKEYSLEAIKDPSTTNQIELNKLQLQKRLGLVASGKVFSTGLESLFSKEDFDIKCGLASNNETYKKQTTSETLNNNNNYNYNYNSSSNNNIDNNNVISNNSNINNVTSLKEQVMESAREKVRNKRKNRALMKSDADMIVNNTQPNSINAASTDAELAVSIKESVKRAKIDGGDSTDVSPINNTVTQSEDNLYQSTQNDKCNAKSEDIALSEFSNILFSQLFSHQWEIRHGAALGLKEVIQAKIKSLNSSAQNVTYLINNSKWKEDSAVKLLCVLCLDKFADYVSDEAVAPVRESCAQCLGVLSISLSDVEIKSIFNIISQMIQSSKWEIQYSSLLSIKYILAARNDITSKVIPKLVPFIISHLADASNDDVRAAAASALLPALSQILTYDDNNNNSSCCCSSSSDGLTIGIMKSIMNCLNDLDDLSVSTKSVLNVIEESLTLRKDILSLIHTHLGIDFCQFAHVLLKYVTHSLTVVRKNALNTLLTLMRNSPELDELSIPNIFELIFNLLFERIFIENKSELRILSSQIFKHCLAVCPTQHLFSIFISNFSTWIKILIASPLIPLPPALFQTSIQFSDECFSLLDKNSVYIGGINVLESSNEQTEAAMKLRDIGCSVIAKLYFKLTTELKIYFEDALHHLLSGYSFLELLIPSFLIKEISSASDSDKPFNVSIYSLIHQKLTEQPILSELQPLFEKLNFLVSILSNFISSASNYSHLPVLPTYENFNIDCAMSLIDYCDRNRHFLTEMNIEIQPTYDELTENVLKFKTDFDLYLSRINTAFSSILISSNSLPDKLNPLIRPIMECLKKDSIEYFQTVSANALCQLLEACESRSSSPNYKIIKNLTAWSIIRIPESDIPNLVPSSEDNWSWNNSIISYHTSNNAITSNTNSKGKHKYAKYAATIVSARLSTPDYIQRRGARIALKVIASHFHSELPNKLESFWWQLSDSLKASSQHLQFNQLDDLLQHAEMLTQVISSLSLLYIVSYCLAEQLVPRVIEYFPFYIKYLSCSVSSIRHIAAKAIGNLVLNFFNEFMPLVIKLIVPLTSLNSSLHERQGALECIAYTIPLSKEKLVTYNSLLILPILSLTMDNNEEIRFVASNAFSHLVQLIAIEPSEQEFLSIPQDLRPRYLEEKQFIEKLNNPKKISNFDLNISLNVTLRKYQQEGINWLNFLRQYNLHGILCDDMGLGKTLQSLCIIVENLKYIIDTGSNYGISLVVCPPTIVGHWDIEIKNFFPLDIIQTLLYVGMPLQRQKLQSMLKMFKGLIISSYDIVRNDIEFLKTIPFDFIILDEGHIIKNHKTKLSKTIKELKGNHRLILTGTPIQNNVLELWSLFDFLMPGFLGTHKEFNDQFGKPILLSRDSKSSLSDQEAGIIAVESLHRKVLPFILRRMKTDVLKDLPPKIIQDYYCSLTAMQEILYEKYTEFKDTKELSNLIENHNMPTSNIKHVFQALQYLRKVCNHPGLIFDDSTTYGEAIQDILSSTNTAITDSQHSCKLVSLKQLLQDSCNHDSLDPDSSLSLSIINQHRILIFCQLKKMLDIIEKMFIAELPQITYLRLDGNVPNHMRMDIVNKFNSDPSIDVLLLTTQVGGLGLSLTGADIVIFYDHDWNPMKDLQAMDRAHRIGQKRVVNVYRLITKGTLEEKIMGLQKFKLNIANTIITDENSSLSRMGSDHLANLFSSKQETREDSAPSLTNIRDILNSHAELWDEQQYEDAYDIKKFVSSL